MRYISNDGSTQFHFCLKRGGWTLIAMGRDPLYRPAGGFTLRDRVAEMMESEGSDYKRPVFEIDYVGCDLVSVFVAEHCSANPADFVLSWVRSIEDELALGILSILEAMQDDQGEWKPYLNGLQKTMFYRPVFEEKGALVDALNDRLPVDLDSRGYVGPTGVHQSFDRAKTVAGYSMSQMSLAPRDNQA